MTRLMLVSLLLVVSQAGCQFGNRPLEPGALELVGQCLQSTQELLLGTVSYNDRRGTTYILEPTSSDYFRRYPEEIVDRLSVGTRFQVVSVDRKNLSMTANCWEVNVKLLDATYSNIIAEIPACGFGYETSWLNHLETRLGPDDHLQIRPDFAIRCSGD
jgi:hypothetical protein